MSAGLVVVVGAKERCEELAAYLDPLLPGANVEWAPDGATVMELCEQAKPVAVFLDDAPMTDMEPMVVHRKLVERYGKSELPQVVLLARDTRSVEQWRGAKLAHVLCWPFTEQELNGVVNQIAM